MLFVREANRSVLHFYCGFAARQDDPTAALDLERRSPAVQYGSVKWGGEWKKTKSGYHTYNKKDIQQKKEDEDKKK